MKRCNIKMTIYDYRKLISIAKKVKFNFYQSFVDIIKEKIKANDLNIICKKKINERVTIAIETSDTIDDYFIELIITLTIDERIYKKYVDFYDTENRCNWVYAQSLEKYHTEIGDFYYQIDNPEYHGLIMSSRKSKMFYWNNFLLK